MHQYKERDILLEVMAKHWKPPKNQWNTTPIIEPHNKGYILIILCLYFNSCGIISFIIAKSSRRNVSKLNKDGDVQIWHFQWMNIHVIWCLQKTLPCWARTTQLPTLGPFLSNKQNWHKTHILLQEAKLIKLPYHGV